MANSGKVRVLKKRGTTSDIMLTDLYSHKNG